MQELSVDRTVSVEDLRQYGFQRAEAYNSGQYTYTVPAYLYHGKALLWLEVRIFAKTPYDSHYALHIDCKTDAGLFYSPYYNPDDFPNNHVLKQVMKRQDVLIAKLVKDHILWKPKHPGKDTEPGNRQSHRNTTAKHTQGGKRNETAQGTTKKGGTHPSRNAKRGNMRNSL